MCCQKQSHIFKTGDLSIFEAYKISGDDAEVQILEFGTWENGGGGGGGGGELLLAAGADENIWRRRADLKGKHLRLVMPICRPCTTMFLLKLSLTFSKKKSLKKANLENEA